MEYNGYSIEHDGTFGYKEIKPIGKGSVPKELRGKYTTAVTAKQAIDAYVREKKSNATTKRASSSK